ncbi:hypothetical protein TRFO_21325 [Tritrichomonas foetus]|uniref:Uncharacterized protein n=1 Tax=Tritrichomonas foetus TaxID=1144522 RepID=A0A1J4KJ49_9EUKA|nr:hypothetical protein TRFO_21325 [Tritrichomonas foetus]|eukprot:OHT09702.1 hypothetical protein TRFO_21325 [Tritrichomonas foetus]
MLERKNSRNSRNLTLISFAFLLFAISMIYFTNPFEVSDVIPENANPDISANQYREPDLPPRKATNGDPNNKIYIAIIDSEYKPSDIQCQLKDAWIKDIDQYNFIDGVEFYSNVSFQNEKCDIQSISFPQPPSRFNMKHNPSCMIMKNMLKIFLERSDAGWLLYVTDSAFVNLKNLQKLIHSLYCNDPINQPRISGHCIEVRDYFQIFVKNSGALISRKTALLLSQTEKIWNISCEIEIDGSEAVAHSLDVNKMYAIRNHNQRFLGHPFTQEKFYDILLNKKFSELEKCPLKYESKRVCSPTTQPINELAVWSSVGDYMNKSFFIQNAKRMLEVDSSVYFKYNGYQSELCVF